MPRAGAGAESRCWLVQRPAGLQEKIPGLEGCWEKQEGDKLDLELCGPHRFLDM